MRKLRSFYRNALAGTAAEFALVLPLAVIFLFGIIDVGRLMWTWNKAEKATQMGVRAAVVTEVVPEGLIAERYVGDVIGGVTLTQGDLIPAAALGDIECVSTGTVASCRCKTAPCPATLTPVDGPAFNFISTRVTAMLPEASAANVILNYQGSGVGFAGDPVADSPEIAPLVTVSLRNLTFTPLLLQVFGGSIALPDFSATLTLEDGVGAVSN